jgi:hypothetical protein
VDVAIADLDHAGQLDRLVDAVRGDAAGVAPRRDAADRVPHRALRCLDDVLAWSLEVGQAERLERGHDRLARGSVPGRLRVQVAEVLFRCPHVGAHHPDEQCVRFPGREELLDRDEDALLELRVRFDPEPATAHVGQMAQAADVGHEPTAMEDGRHDRVVVELARCRVRIVGDENVTRRERARRERRDEVPDRVGHRVDVPGCPGAGLGQHVAIRQEDARGEIAGFAHDGREGRPDQGRRLLIGSREQPVPDQVVAQDVHPSSPSP